MIGLFGRFQLSVKNTKTGKVTDTRWINNLVLNNAFTSVLSNEFWYIQLGTGSTAPSVSDTSLVSLLVTSPLTAISPTKAGATTTFTDPIYSTSAGIEVSFAIGAVVGNVSEIGAYAGGKLLTRALITDEFGVPTTITLGVDDLLTVHYLIGYELDTSFPAGSAVANFNGTNINLTPKWVDLGKGLSNSNGMNGNPLPYMVAGYITSYYRVVSTLPSDPLSDINGGVTPAIYLTPSSSTGGAWNLDIAATGSSWLHTTTFTVSLSGGVGEWNGIAIGPNIGMPAVLFEFDAPFTKTASQEVTISVQFELQRA